MSLMLEHSGFLVIGRGIRNRSCPLTLNFLIKLLCRPKFSIQKLEKDGFIVRQQFRVAHGIMTDIANGTCAHQTRA